MNNGFQKLSSGELLGNDLKGYITANLLSDLFLNEIDKEDFALEQFKKGDPDTYPHEYQEAIAERTEIVRKLKHLEDKSDSDWQRRAESDKWFIDRRITNGRELYSKLISNCRQLLAKAESWEIGTSSLVQHLMVELESIKSELISELKVKLSSAEASLVELTKDTTPITGAVVKQMEKDKLLANLDSLDKKINTWNQERSKILALIALLPV